MLHSGHSWQFASASHRCVHRNAPSSSTQSGHPVCPQTAWRQNPSMQTALSIGWQVCKVINGTQQSFTLAHRVIHSESMASWLGLGCADADPLSPISVLPAKFGTDGRFSAHADVAMAANISPRVSHMPDIHLSDWVCRFRMYRYTIPDLGASGTNFRPSSATGKSPLHIGSRLALCPSCV